MNALVLLTSVTSYVAENDAELPKQPKPPDTLTGTGAFKIVRREGVLPPPFVQVPLTFTGPFGAMVIVQPLLVVTTAPLRGTVRYPVIGEPYWPDSVQLPLVVVVVV